LACCSSLVACEWQAERKQKMTRSSSQSFSRDSDLRYIAERVLDGDCCSLVGVSNVGKSRLLRAWQRPEVVRAHLGDVADEVGFVYIDFNLMLEMSEQGFYELIMRTVLTLLRQLPTESAIYDRVNDAYQRVVGPTNPFQVPLSFNEGIITLCEDWPRRLVFLFDEFDEVFLGIDERVFLNLRALRDRYPDQLSYVVATLKQLTESRRGLEIGEFYELFAHDTRCLGMLARRDSLRMMDEFAREEELAFTSEDRAFILTQAGGHPGLLKATCHLFYRAFEQDEPDRVRAADYRLLREWLEDDATVRGECVKLWNNLPAELQEALINFLGGVQIGRAPLRRLREEGILTKSKGGGYQVFGKAFEGLACRQRLLQEPVQPGVHVDVEAGEVYVDGCAVPVLTDLEYRLMLLLYGQIDKICDKYRIVESVWGEDYIDEVDDARIEKLISRLRQKIEPDPSNPRYLITVRGRGYRLLSRPAH
jgi:DNA-binding winged helix-turn-helix (wHTH) protein